MTERTLGDAIAEALIGAGWIHAEPTNRRAEMLDYIRTHPGRTTAEIAAQFCQPSNTVSTNLRRLAEQGRIVSTRVGKEHTWVVV